MSEIPLARCRTCGNPIFWVVLESGERNPLEPAPLHPAAATPGMVVVNPKTGRGRVLREEDCSHVQRWHDAGALMYASHFGSARCAQAERVHAEQQTLL